MSNFAETLIVAGGIFNLGFAIFHLMFWQLFHWKKDLASLTLINRAVMQILNLCLTFIFIATAFISFFHSSEIVSSGLGRSLMIVFSLFWFLRMIEQIIFFGVKNKVSLGLTLVFFVGSVIYALPVLVKL